MPKKISPEEAVVAFFNNHVDLSKVETVFNIVKGVVKSRLTPVTAAKTRTRGPNKSTLTKTTESIPSE